VTTPLPQPIRPRTLDEAIEQNEALWKVIESLTTQLEQQQSLIDDLRAKAAEEEAKAKGEHSGNSSRPPSSDTAAQRGRRKKRKSSGRSQGAQKGHKKHERALVEPDESQGDTVTRYFPDAMCACGGEVAMDNDPSVRHQVFDLPVVRYHLAEHQLFGGRCTGCGCRHQAETPTAVPNGQMGSGLIAFIALLAGENHQSVRQIQRLLRELWQLDFSVGAISNSQGKASEALADSYGDIGAHVQQSAVAHADETRHPRGGGGYPGTWWMWVLTTNMASYFGVHVSRGKKAAAELLGAFAGVLVTDDYAGYNDVPASRRQLCWSHLIRHFTAISERLGKGGAIGKALLLGAQLVIRTRHRFDADEIDFSRYRRRMLRLQKWIHETLERGARLKNDKRTQRQCRHLLKREQMLWTFLSDPRIDLTNNRAERMLRPYVIWRRLAFGSHSRRGDAFRARVLSVTTTARQLKVPVYAFLRQVCTEHQRFGTVRTTLPLDQPRLDHQAA